MRLAFTVAFLFLAAPSLAQTPTAGPGAKLAWDHDRVNTTKFEAIIDGGTSGVTHQVGLPATNEWPLPALTGGNHSAQVRACNAAGCSAWSTALQFQVIVVPSAVPTNLRIAPQVINSGQRAPIAPPLTPIATNAPRTPEIPRFE